MFNEKPAIHGRGAFFDGSRKTRIILYTVKINPAPSNNSKKISLDSLKNSLFFTHERGVEKEQILIYKAT